MPATAPVDVLVTLHQPHSPAAEAFRRLRTNVQFANVDKPLRSVAVISAQPRSGKSVIAANLAVAFAQAGKRVILIDADLLHPSQHELFGLPNAQGLTSVISGRGVLDADLQPTALEALRVLPAGPSSEDSPQLLTAPGFENLLTQLTEFADIIVLDTPSLAEFADSALLASKVDGVLLVVDSGKSKRDDVVSARDLLQRVHANVLGVALNHGHDGGARIRRGRRP